MTDCTYCGCEVEAHDPLTVSSGVGVAEDDSVEGWFCNYGCLVAHVEREGLAEGTSCRVDL